MSHEWGHMTWHGVYHVLPGQGELWEHQHSQQRGHRVTWALAQVETGELMKVGRMSVRILMRKEMKSKVEEC